MLSNIQRLKRRVASIAIKKKWRNEIILVVVSLLFLQLFLYYSYTRTYVSRGSYQTANKSVIHRAMIERMLKQSRENNIELFLIQPSTLETNSSLLETLGELEVVTFGVHGNNSVMTKDWISNKFRNHHLDTFKVFCNSTVHIPARVIYNMTEIPCHYFIYIQNYDLTYHLIVFYERRNNFTWSDEVLIKNGSQPSWLYLDRLEFGKFPVSFKSLETESRRIGNITVPVGKYVKNFTNNRFIECDYARANVYLKQNNISSKVRNSYISLKFINLLGDASKALDEVGSDFWLSSGTLLGWYRECGIIQYTSDVDIEMNITQHSSNITAILTKHGFRHIYTFGTLKSGYEYSFLWHNKKMDMFFAYEDGVSSWIGGTISKNNHIKFIVPKFTLCWTELLGLRVRVPCQTDKYIEATYGKNWNKPKKHWLWFRDASNIKSVTEAKTTAGNFTKKPRTKNKQSHKLREKREIQNITTTQKNAIKLFILRIKKKKIKVFLIKQLMGNAPGKVITFGVYGTQEIVKHGLISKYFRKDDVDFFTLYCNSTVYIPARKLYKMTEIPCHIFVHHKKRKAIYHIIVFHAKGDNFMWSDEVNVRNGHFPPWLKKSNLDYGESPVSFKSLETESRRIADITVPVGKYVNNFTNNRFIECDYKRANLYLKQNNITTKRNAQKFMDMLREADKALNKIGVEYWLSSGTLLGWYRECGIIPYTTDIDIEIKISQFSYRILSTLKQHGFFHAFTFGKLEAGFQYSFYWHKIKLDVFFSYEDKNTSWIGGALPDHTKIKFVVPKFTLCWSELLGLRVRIPCQTDKYIEATYGKNWNKPTTEWLWYRDAFNVQKLPNAKSSGAGMKHSYTARQKSSKRLLRKVTHMQKSTKQRREVKSKHNKLRTLKAQKVRFRGNLNNTKNPSRAKTIQTNKIYKVPRSTRNRNLPHRA